MMSTRTEARIRQVPSPGPERALLKVFVSYARVNLEFADRLAAALEHRGIDVVIDRRDLPLGIEFQAELLSLIRAADAVLVILTPALLGSKWCAWEIEQATKLSKRLVPVLIEPVEEAGVPPTLSRINYVSFTASDDFDRQCDALTQTLLTDVAWVKEHTRLAERARVWDEHHRSRAFVLRGNELDEAESWAGSQPAAAPPLTGLHREFLRGSRRAATKRLRFWLGGAIAVALTATGLATLAEFNRREAVAQRQRAEGVVAKATGTANALVFELAHRFRSQMGVPQELIVTSLTLSRQLMEELAAGGETHPTVLRSQAIALMELSTALRAQGELPAARKAAQQAVEILDHLPTSTRASIEFMMERSAAYDRLGDAAAELGDDAGALHAYEASLSAIRSLAEANPRHPDLQRNLAVAFEKLADLRLDAGSYDVALALYERSRGIRAQLLKELDRSADAQQDLSVSYEKIGNVLMRKERIDEALSQYRMSLELAESLVAAHPQRSDFLRDLGSSYQRIGNVLYARGEIEQALHMYRKDLEIATRLAGSDTGRPEWQRDLAISHQKVADALYRSNRPDAALDAYSSGCAVLERLIDSTKAAHDLRLLASCERQISRLLAEAGDADRALRVAERAIARARQWGGDEKEQIGLLVEATGNAVWYAVLAKRHPLALQYADQALALEPDALWVELNKAHALLFGGHADAAIKLYLDHRGEDIPGQGTWSEAALSDLAILKKAGLVHPRMDDMESALQAQSIDAR